MHGPLAPLLFVLAVVTATAFLFMVVIGVMIIWVLPVIGLSLKRKQVVAADRG